MIYEKVDSDSLVLSCAELSARMKTPMEAMPPELDLYIAELAAVISPAFVATELDLSKISESEVKIGGTVCKSASLTRVIGECPRAVLLCATLGFESERLLRKYSAMSAAKHFMLDAVSDAMVEALCDAAQERISGSRAHTARFSPGYADLPLEFAGEIVRMTDAQKLLGVRLTESFLAVPAKTVTAIIGIKEKNDNENT